MKPTLSPRKRVLPVTPWTARSYWSLQGLPLLVLSLSLCLFGVGEGMLLVSNLGASPWVVLAQGVSLRSGVGIGTVTFLISVAVITFPPDFAQRLAQGQAAPVQVVLDARNSSTAAAAGSQIAAIAARYNEQELGLAPGIRVQRRAWFNPNLDSGWHLLPGLIASLSMIQTMLLAALGVAREREQGTFDQLLVTPLTPLQILIGKALPSMLAGLLQSSLVLLIIRFWFQVPMAGSLWLLYLGLLAFNAATVGVGLSVSALSLTMQQAMLYNFMLVLPMTLLSGLMTPVRNMPQALQTVTHANPLRFGVSIVRRVYLEGATLTDVAPDFLPLLAMTALSLPLAAWLFRNRLG